MKIMAQEGHDKGRYDFSSTETQICGTLQQPHNGATNGAHLTMASRRRKTRLGLLVLLADITDFIILDVDDKVNSS